MCQTFVIIVLNTGQTMRWSVVITDEWTVAISCFQTLWEVKMRRKYRSFMSYDGWCILRRHGTNPSIQCFQIQLPAWLMINHRSSLKIKPPCPMIPTTTPSQSLHLNIMQTWRLRCDNYPAASNRSVIGDAFNNLYKFIHYVMWQEFTVFFVVEGGSHHQVVSSRVCAESKEAIIESKKAITPQQQECKCKNHNR